MCAFRYTSSGYGCNRTGGNGEWEPAAGGNPGAILTGPRNEEFCGQIVPLRAVSWPGNCFEAKSIDSWQPRLQAMSSAEWILQRTCKARYNIRHTMIPSGSKIKCFGCGSQNPWSPMEKLHCGRSPVAKTVAKIRSPDPPSVEPPGLLPVMSNMRFVHLPSGSRNQHGMF